MAESKNEITEASVKEFDAQLNEKANALKIAEEKYLKRLVIEAKDAGVDFAEDNELIEIGEKGIMKLIEQAKKMKESKKVTEEATIKETRGEVATEVKEYAPIWRSGAIKVQGNEMWSEWKEGYFQTAFLRAACGKPLVEDY